VRARFRHALVIHASDLPKGRGWSPHIWSILRGDDHLTVSLPVADDPVDSGAIFTREIVPLAGTELYDEVHRKLFEAELRLMTWALDACDRVTPTAPTGTPHLLAPPYAGRRPGRARGQLRRGLRSAPRGRSGAPSCLSGASRPALSHPARAGAK
jgi:methionyl-tRNA formyltransferase